LPQAQQPRGGPAARGGVERLLAAIRQVESGGDPAAVGDGGRSLGAYQISLAYWADGGGRRERWRLDARDDAACRSIIRAYWRRYCPAALAGEDLQTLARVHNGGPTGARKAATLPYWRAVRAELERQRGRNAN